MWFGHDVGKSPGNTTACGVPTQLGVIATHLWGYGDNIPFGTVMFVEGYGIGVVCDVGRLTKTDIDLCLDDFTIRDLLSAGKLKNSTRRVWYIEP
jgi:3D (Asp-Asp-Asp) domain-containing protein